MWGCGIVHTMLRHTNTLRLLERPAHWTPTHVALSNILAAMMDGNDEAWPSVAYLADQLGCSVRHTRRLLAQLESDGVIARDYRANRSTVYLWTNWPIRLVQTGHPCPVDRTPVSGEDRTPMSAIRDQLRDQEETKARARIGPVDNRGMAG